jgi:BirA family transcriptional regulator, biotin operon repressor / biotin---[acetyl-CoA-carboxylase] ligase
MIDANKSGASDRRQRTGAQHSSVSSPYTDLRRPPLHEAALRRGLVGPPNLWTDLRVVAETGSTNADLAARARAGADQGAVLIAERQTAGKGRLDRAWESPARAGITVSVLLRPPVPPVRLAWLPLLAGVALVEAVGRVALVDAGLKWPNDLLVRPGSEEGEYGKCAGVLAEAVGSGIVLGLGLNVSQTADELPPRADKAAFAPTSLALSGAVTTDRDPLVRAILRTLARWYGIWVEHAGDPNASGVRQAYQDSCLTLGTQVSVALPGGNHVSGLASDVDGDGRLVVQTPTGPNPVAAGDVQRVR